MCVKIKSVYTMLTQARRLIHTNATQIHAQTGTTVAGAKLNGVITAGDERAAWLAAWGGRPSIWLGGDESSSAAS